MGIYYICGAKKGRRKRRGRDGEEGGPGQLETGARERTERERESRLRRWAGMRECCGLKQVLTVSTRASARRIKNCRAEETRHVCHVQVSNKIPHCRTQREKAPQRSAPTGEKRLPFIKRRSRTWKTQKDTSKVRGKRHVHSFRWCRSSLSGRCTRYVFLQRRCQTQRGTENDVTMVAKIGSATPKYESEATVTKRRTERTTGCGPISAGHAAPRLLSLGAAACLAKTDQKGNDSQKKKRIFVRLQ